MMIRKALLAAAFLGAAATAHAADKLQWPAGAYQENDTRVVAFYNAQCAEWADENRLSAGARDSFIAKCLKDMPDMYPVGFDKAEGGDDG